MTKFIILLICIPLGISCSYNLINVFIDLCGNLETTHLFFLGGTIFSLIVVAIYRIQLTFFCVFEHELTHNIWSMFFFKKPMGFHVNTDGTGLFQYISGDSKFSDVFISLAPYFFPTVCFLWLPFHVMCKVEYYWFYFMMMGIFFGYHVMSTIHETNTKQTDITDHGVLYSYVTFIPLYAIFHGMILAHLNNGFEGIVNFMYYDNLENLQTLVHLF